MGLSTSHVSSDFDIDSSQSAINLPAYGADRYFLLQFWQAFHLNWGKCFSNHEKITLRIMGWLSKLFKGSSHKIPERHIVSDVHGEHPALNNACASEDVWAECENEDIDIAIALSLLEEDKKGKHVIDHESQLKEDEQLARSLQERLNPPSPPQNEYGNGFMSQPLSIPFSAGYRICAGCHTEIGNGRFLSCMGAIWHPECFRCHACNLPISGHEFSISGGNPYHRTCYKEHYHPKCGVCKQFIPTNAAGLIEYRAHPFWDQKYCPLHELDGTPRCCSCERLEPLDTGFVSLDDGRNLCLECLDSAIMNTKQCQPLYLDVQEFYESLNMKVEQQVPLLLVERQALNEALEGEKHGHHHMPETRGLCLSEEQSITTVLQRPRMGAGNGTMDLITEPYKLTRYCDVTAILVLHGLPRLLTGSILAHEMMHAWLRLKGFHTLNPQIEEGICQVLAFLWLESELMSGSGGSEASTSFSVSRPPKRGMRSPFEMKLGKFFKNQIESDISPVYGYGFRAASQAVLKYGLGRTLDHLQVFLGLHICIIFDSFKSLVVVGAGPQGVLVMYRFQVNSDRNWTRSKLTRSERLEGFLIRTIIENQGRIIGAVCENDEKRVTTNPNVHPFTLEMVNTRVQASPPVRDTVARGDDPLVGSRAGEQPKPDVHKLAADVDDMKQMLKAPCTLAGAQWLGTAPSDPQALTSRRRKPRRKALAARTTIPDDTEAHAISGSRAQTTARSLSSGDVREESPERRNPHNSRNDRRLPTRGEGSCSTRPPYADGHHDLRSPQENSKLKDFINAKRSGSTRPIEETSGEDMAGLVQGGVWTAGA
ncbi:hypothetical protein Nepgr_015712 [Nepenthes gracilis]|uniref:LIM zinc-binding domain-containing protein n=1 Tax=Nepenthes gracilis TaxID=150966 RepID=A0AAD3SP37_NEPGR|nr:hypothetical protein Nepgr_015712 [Nepenthes gracilis]